MTPRTTGTDDQVSAILRDCPPGLTTAEVWQASCDTTARPRRFEYLDIYRSLRRLECTGMVLGLRLGAGQGRMILWSWRGLPVRIPGAVLGDQEETST